MTQGCRNPWSKDELYHFWMLVHRRPRWLPFLCERLGLDAKEEAFLSDLDDDWLVTAKHWAARWRKEVAVMVAESFGDTANEYSEWARRRRQTTKWGRLTEEQLQRARSRPLESLLPAPPAKGYIHCLVHQERIGRQDTHPSMLVKGGFGYCFSCGGTLDSIGYLMKIRGLSFRQAIEALQ